RRHVPNTVRGKEAQHRTKVTAVPSFYARAHQLHQLGGRGLLGHRTAKYHARPSLPLCELRERPRYSRADVRFGRRACASADARCAIAMRKAIAPEPTP